MYMYMYMYMYMHMHMYMHMYVYMYMYMYMYMYTYMYMYMYMYVYVYMHMYVHMYVYLDTRMLMPRFAKGLLVLTCLICVSVLLQITSYCVIFTTIVRCFLCVYSLLITYSCINT